MTEFDPEAFGKAMGALIREATEPLLNRIAQLESRQPKKGEPGPPATDEQIAREIRKYIAANPLPRGEKGEPGINGTDAEPLEVREVIRELLATDELMSIVELRAKEEVARIPPAKDGKDGAPGPQGEKGQKGDRGEDGAGVADLLIDRDGSLVATMTDGRMKSLGVVIGKDGAPGRDGKDGADFSSAEFDYDGERGLIIRGSGGEIVRRLPIPIDRGYWREGAFEKGDIVTHGGTAYIALRDTKMKPSLESKEDWRILARKGRDGKDGRNGIDKTQPVNLKLDKDDGHA